jgi:hypothetical protein
MTNEEKAKFIEEISKQIYSEVISHEYLSQFVPQGDESCYAMSARHAVSYAKALANAVEKEQNNIFNKEDIQ